MSGPAAWIVAREKPARLSSATIGLEKDLESWI